MPGARGGGGWADDGAGVSRAQCRVCRLSSRLPGETVGCPLAPRLRPLGTHEPGRPSCRGPKPRPGPLTCLYARRWDLLPRWPAGDRLWSVRSSTWSSAVPWGPWSRALTARSIRQGGKPRATPSAKGAPTPGQGRLRHRPPDRATLAGLSTVLAWGRWRAFLVKPETLLRWHREASRRRSRRWYPKRRVGRPPLPEATVDLIVRLDVMKKRSAASA
jgi:hypothetical protein